jgi:flagellar hook-basal body protein
VGVSFDATSKQFVFTTATTGNQASILVSGAADWGLNTTTTAFGETSSWTRPKQHTEDGVLQYVRDGEQTADQTGLSTDTEWWPLYLDRGELSFDLSGRLLSPPNALSFGNTLLDGGQGALSLQLDLSQSTQYSSPFAVLGQAQDGLPEGELMGLDVAEDGLVRASYSNGSQVALGKVVLANFSNPTGLQQIGDASYLASGAAGALRLGEAVSTGYGSIRAGATEGANVDLTQELVDLITAQRNFQANAKAIETATAMTQAIINVRS